MMMLMPSEMNVLQFFNVLFQNITYWSNFNLSERTKLIF